MNDKPVDVKIMKQKLIIYHNYSLMGLLSLLLKYLFTKKLQIKFKLTSKFLQSVCDEYLELFLCEY